MDRRKYLGAAFASAGMMLLILDSRCAVQSGQQAVEFCIRSVIPSLFPFLFLSGLLTGTLWGSEFCLLKIGAYFFQIPAGGEALLLSSLLGGYPAGAIAVGDAFRGGRLKQETARRLLAYCSNAGPAFLFGMMSFQFPEKWMIWSLWGIHLLSAAMVGAVLNLPAEALEGGTRKQKSVSEILMLSVQSMGMICGWILLFRILLGFLDRWFFWMLPDWGRALLWGILELSNGCWALREVENIALRFIAASAMLAFGGICVMMQTATAARGLSMKGYIFGKILQTLFSTLLAAAVCRGLGGISAAICISFVILQRIRKKEVAFRRFTVYNADSSG